MKSIYIIFFIFCQSYSAYSKVQTLTDKNWDQILQNEWMILLHAPWCPACQSIKPEWQSFSDEITKSHPINVGDIDITKNPVVSGSFMISRLPSFFHVKDGIFRQYTGDRRFSGLLKFIKEENYKSIDPLPWYYKPNSIFMRLLGHLFHLSQIIQNAQNNMQLKYGWPVWVSYVVIGAIIVALGLFVSVLFFCIMLLLSKLNIFPKETASNKTQPVEDLLRNSMPDVDMSSDDPVLSVEQKVGEISLGGDDLNEQYGSITSRRRIY